MSVVRRENEASRRGDAGSAFELSEQMAEALRLMANPAAGVMAMSALGFGVASHAFGLWAGVLTGSAQAAQRLLSAQVRQRHESAQVSVATISARREKPDLKVVASSESPAPAPAAEEVEIQAPSVTPKRAEPVEKRAEPVERAGQGRTAASRQERVRKPEENERPAAPDDLKAISGIGPKLEKVLNDLGVWTYRQVAAWGAAEVAWMDDRLGFPGRIARDGWVAQAEALSSAAAKTGKA
jgi:NADH-quinone oxidoreductase subunit E